ncbi:MAG: ATP-dependent DNA helicase, partial [Prevotella sp.]|nr:ATP-dependent DNA helicase [Prevotella sp.]
FYQRKEIKDIIAYFRLVCNPSDEEAIKRIINYPARGIGNTTIQKISDAAQKSEKSFWEVVANPVENGLSVSKGTMQKLADFVAMMSGFIEKIASADAYDLGREIVKNSGISDDLYAENEPEHLFRQQNLEEFLNSLADFVDTRREEGREREIFLPDFLQEVSLLTDLDSDDGNESRVLLMTIHAAKGLEFSTVFVVGVEEDIFHSQEIDRTRDKDKDDSDEEYEQKIRQRMREIEEERRLLYVAITRAKKRCILTWAKSRWRYGKMEFGKPSRFLDDIDREFIDVERESSSGSFGGFSGRFQMQNSRPVASQFMADRQPKITSPRRPEPSVEPFSESFKRKLEAASSGRNLRRIPSSSSSSFKPSNSSPFNSQKSSASSGTNSPLQVGNIIEHQRFGIGTVTQIEGSGENTKATVEFRHVGTKQLLLKFARYTIVKA